MKCITVVAGCRITNGHHATVIIGVVACRLMLLHRRRLFVRYDVVGGAVVVKLTIGRSHDLVIGIVMGIVVERRRIRSSQLMMLVVIAGDGHFFGMAAHGAAQTLRPVFVCALLVEIKDNY